MSYGLMADAVLVLHLAFIIFVLVGGIAVLRWPRLAWIHIPAAAWGALIEFAGWIFDNGLRHALQCVEASCLTVTRRTN